MAQTDRQLPLRAFEQQRQDQQQQTQPTSSEQQQQNGRPRKSTLTLDLSNLPVTKPTPPSNTLIFTNLMNPEIFQPDNLQKFRDELCQDTTVKINTFSPLKSFARIIVSFQDEDAAIRVRAKWDGTAILGDRCRIYFGQPTPVGAPTRADTHLALPDAGKLFFISPPPSPPHGWEQRCEEPPNKMVHADDLAEALAKLKQYQEHGGNASPITPSSVPGDGERKTRSRSSTLIFQPEAMGANPDLPCVTVDDMTDDLEERGAAGFPPAPRPPVPIKLLHTARPPVELMHDA